MSHLSIEKMEKFIHGELSEQEKEDIRVHLEHCDSCFGWYMNIIDEWEPGEKLSDSFTDGTLRLLEEKIPDSRSRDKSSRHVTRKTIIHYGIAAGLTLCLMFTGAFQKVTDVTDAVENRDTSITSELMKKTSGLFKIIEPGKEDKQS
ncbi:putative zinc finger protein [Melghiribacillus thermohalophilus]|uniref:Putative zinc finger protein n=1 Tax=Melghiribacillus thermohalophilus TaxID=1324956 RepID=A0A4R3MW37_9BACI|nr:zf-HC2 domain-containing protein [Melghiribacillus thermohalophilus]TCT19651.1 putative zinc finger protein [Melghiribacillus thermohalophilus]